MAWRVVAQGDFRGDFWTCIKQCIASGPFFVNQTIRSFELWVRSEFYCSNDVIVGHISHLDLNFRETVRSMLISGILYSGLSPGP